ncbi:MAG TPA: ferredoxin, partial [Candidatus Kapabacteria bacterium]|nr:ferredoxin [Candidatus Kapabacteria bacterium]
MASINPKEKIFWDAADARGEMQRVFDVCNGCRLCDNLCPSFTDLFDRIDVIDDEQEKAGRGSDNPALALTDAEFDHVTDVCYQCKICYVKCPYTPPHEYQLDFPRLLLRWQAIQTKAKGGNALQNIALGNTNTLGAIGKRIPALMNWANKNPLTRWMMEKTVG